MSLQKYKHFLKPQKYINLSGDVLIKFVSFFDIKIEDIIVISDDLDLPIGSIKLKEKGFDLNDLLDQMKQIHKMGSMRSILNMLPGMGNINDEQIEQSEVQLRKTEAMINSMTMKEREKPSIINPNRKRRIAAGSGTQVSDVNALLRQFEQMQKMMKQLGLTGKGNGKKGMKNRANLLKGLGGGMGGFPM